MQELQCYMSRWSRKCWISCFIYYKFYVEPSNLENLHPTLEQTACRFSALLFCCDEAISFLFNLFLLCYKDFSKSIMKAARGGRNSNRKNLNNFWEIKKRCPRQQQTWAIYLLLQMQNHCLQLFHHLDLFSQKHSPTSCWNFYINLFRRSESVNTKWNYGADGVGKCSESRVTLEWNRVSVPSWRLPHETKLTKF